MGIWLAFYDGHLHTLTHSQWDVQARDHKDRAHPILYNRNFDDVLVSRTRAKRCLFLRKVKRPLDLSVWEYIVVRQERGCDSGTNTGMTQTWTDDMRGRENGAEREMDQGGFRKRISLYTSRPGHDMRISHSSNGQEAYNNNQRRKREWNDQYNHDDSQKQEHWRW